MLYWLMARINHNPVSLYEISVGALLLASTVWVAYSGGRAARRALEPRRDRLRELLSSLTAAE